MNKPGFRSNDEAKATYKHNGKDEELEYPHPVIQVAAKVDIVKIDQTGAALEGAKFNLYNDKYNAKKTIVQNAGCLIEANLQSKKPTTPAGNDAVIRSGKLGAGTYYLVETETPAGYISLSGPVKITVTETNGVFSMTAEIAGVSVGNDKLAKSDNGWKLSIQNSAGYELPHTGGPGTKTIYLTGLLLLVFAGIGLMMRRRYRC
ncbi:MAG: LPXTG cell wall anchor domain-containing protein [Lachnospiraceae bacterium]|nr:LPXTG cell wall anchor domain-containing protein [Lachnospiraceae bacterium]